MPATTRRLSWSLFPVSEEAGTETHELALSGETLIGRTATGSSQAASQGTDDSTRKIVVNAGKDSGISKTHAQLRVSVDGSLTLIGKSQNSMKVIQSSTPQQPRKVGASSAPLPLADGDIVQLDGFRAAPRFVFRVQRRDTGARTDVSANERAAEMTTDGGKKSLAAGKDDGEESDVTAQGGDDEASAEPLPKRTKTDTGAGIAAAAVDETDAAIPGPKPTVSVSEEAPAGKVVPIGTRSVQLDSISRTPATANTDNSPEKEDASDEGTNNEEKHDGGDAKDWTPTQAEQEGAIKMLAESQDSEGESEDEEEEEAMDEPLEETALEDVTQLLDSLDNPGDTCAGGRADMPHLPGLVVEGVGDISLPLNEVQAKMLAATAERAPHGKGLKTVVDISVRNTLQIAPGRVSFENPMWQPQLQKLVLKVAEELGVPPRSVKAELYKLLLYEKGGHFKPHRDTEKAQGMFATLVVQLPSRFTGGEMIIRHAGKQRSFPQGADTGMCAFGVHYVCHYADCEHEVMPVESGYRLSAVYSLCYTGSGPKPSVDGQGSGVQELRQTIHRLPKGSLMVLPLDHQYTTSSVSHMGVAALKGTDRLRHNGLAAAADKSLDFFVVFAQRTDTEMGDGSYYGGFHVEDTEEGAVEITDVFNADGGVANAAVKSTCEKGICWQPASEGGNLLCAEDVLEEVFGEGDPGGVEYTGNEGATRETTYHCSVLVAYRSADELELQCNSNLPAVTNRICGAGAAVHASDFHRLVSFVLSRPTTSVTLAENAQIQLLRSAVHLLKRKTEHALLDAKRIISKLLKTITMDVTTALLDAVNHAGWVTVEPAISALMNQIRLHTRTDDLQNAKALVDQVTGRVRLLLALENSKQGFLTSEGQPLAQQVAVDVVAMLETAWGLSGVAPRQRYQYYGYNQHATQKAGGAGSVVEMLSIDVVRFLFSTATDALLERIAKWAEKAEAPVLKQISVCLPDAAMLASSSLPDIALRCVKQLAAISAAKITAAENQAREAELKKQHEAREAALKKLRASESQLVMATSAGTPQFSWAMTRAAFTNPAIQTFLRSAETRRSIVVGGGINNARRLAGALNGDNGRHHYRYHTASKPTEAELVQRGYSVTATTSGTGSNACVSVTKTRDFFNADLANFEKSVVELKQVRKQITALEKQHVAARSRASGEGEKLMSSARQHDGNGSKRQRVDEPGTAEAQEVITLDD